MIDEQSLLQIHQDLPEGRLLKGDMAARGNADFLAAVELVQEETTNRVQRSASRTLAVDQPVASL